MKISKIKQKNQSNKKKIGLCIKYYHENYGGMLQSFATIKLLEKYDCDYEIIRYRKKNTIVRNIKNIPRLLNPILLNDKYEALQKKLGLLIHPEFKRNNNIRLSKFKDFKEKKFKKLSKEYIGYEELTRGSKNYNTIISGSDQLWSPAGLPTNFYNLEFADDSVIKASYASSFGVKKIPWYQKKRTIHYLNRINYISVRENQGANIIYNLTKKKVPTVLDPVMLLSKDEWNNYIPNTPLYNEKYILVYFLGNNHKYRKVVEEIAKIENLKIISLNNLDRYLIKDGSYGDYSPYDIGPEEFLNLIRNAECVCTDSFHGSLFSIINEKKLIIFDRYSENSKISKNSRIDSLCENFDISKCRYKGNILENYKNKINYKNIEAKLNLMKKNSIDYIEQFIK